MGKGKLKFKGDKEPTKKKKKSKHQGPASSLVPVGSEAVPSHAPDISLPSSSTSARLSSASTQSQAQVPQGPVIQIGQGRITSSGIVLYGHETKFKTINAGDAILVDVPMDDGSSREEMRVLTIRLSDTSASISSAFSNDLKRPTPFKYIIKPRNIQKERTDKDKKDRMTKDEMERNAFGTYQSGGVAGGEKELVYRERTENNSYRIRRETVKDDTTRGDLLDMRSKKKSDKFC